MSATCTVGKAVCGGVRGLQNTCLDGAASVGARSRPRPNTHRSQSISLWSVILLHTLRRLLDGGLLARAVVRRRVVAVRSARSALVMAR